MISSWCFLWRRVLRVHFLLRLARIPTFRFLFLFLTVFLTVARSQFLSTTISLPDWGIDSLRSIRLGQISTIHASGGDQLRVYSLYDGPSLNRLLLKESAPLSFDSNCFIVSNFDGEALNQLGGGWSSFQRLPSSSSLEYARTSDGRIVLRMSYDRRSSGYCGMWMRLSKAPGFGNNPVFFDARPFGYLTFWIRGTAGGEEVLLKAADAEWDQKEDALAVGNISAFVSSGRIETGWQLAVVPLSGFPGELNHAQLATVVFEASGEGSGAVELKSLAFCKNASPFPDLPPSLPRASEQRSFGKSIWVWNTSEILGRNAEEDNLLSFLRREGFDQVFLALPYDPGDPDARRMISVDAEKFRPLMRKLNQSAITVHALTGDKDFIFPENHEFVTNSIKEVARYNRAASPDERFTGVHFDVEPYLLAGFSSPRRDWILKNFVQLLSKCTETARAEQLRIGADIPAWFDAPDELTGEGLTVSINGTPKPLLDHIFGLMDDVVLMDYRTEAGGENGVTAHARGELKHASAEGKRVFVGLETEPLPDETIMIFRGEPFPGWPSSLQASSFVSLASGPHGLVVAVVSNSEIQTYRNFLESIRIDPLRAIFWPIDRKYRVDGVKLSFATLGHGPLSKAIKESEKELVAYPAFSGFAIHHYESYAKLLRESK